MGCRYQQPADKESEVSFRVVEIYVVDSSHNRAGESSRFLLVDNRRETLELVQKEIQDFVKTAILATRLGKPASITNLGKNC